MQDSYERLASMSASQYVEYLEERFPMKNPVHHAPLRVVSLLIEFLRKYKLDLSTEEKRKGMAKALASTSLLDVTRRALAAIIRALPADSAAKLKGIPITSIPRYKRPNARIALTPGDEPFILIDVEFSLFILDMTKAVSHRFHLPSAPRDRRKPLDRHLVRDFIAKWANYFQTKAATPMPSIEIPRSESAAIWVSLMLHAQRIFSICHELAHHILGHLDESRMETLNIAPAMDIRLYSPEQQQEFEADAIGAPLAYVVFDYYRDQQRANDAMVPMTLIPDMYAAPDVLLTFLHAIHLVGGEQWSPKDTHPPPEKRRQTLRSVLRRSMPERAKMVGQAVESIVNDILYKGKN